MIKFDDSLVNVRIKSSDGRVVKFDAVVTSIEVPVIIPFRALRLSSAKKESANPYRAGLRPPLELKMRVHGEIRYTEKAAKKKAKRAKR